MSNEEVERAIAILEEETKKRINDVEQRVEFMCASLRAQGHTQINKMLMAVRELTVEEFCETYEADAQVFLNQQKQQRLKSSNDNNRKRRLDSFDTASSTELKRRKSSPSRETKEFSTVAKTEDPVFIHINKELKLQINPDLPEKEFEITIPAATLSQLNDFQRTNVRNQIQQFIDQLDKLKKSI